MTKELPLYTCHKKVRALEIQSVGNYHTDNDGKLMRGISFKDGYPSLDLPESMFARYTPMPGDFYVVYEGDGYASFSPRKAFLDGYALAQTEGVLMERLNELATLPLGTSPEKIPEWLAGMDWGQQVARVAREAYVTINGLKLQLENIAREKADPDQS